MANLLLPVIDTESIGWTFNPPTNAMAATFVTMSVTVTTGGIQLVNDALSPGASMYYGTTTSGAKGWFAISGGAVTNAVTGLHVQSQPILTGDVTLIQGANMTLTQSGQTITFDSGGGGGGGLTLIEHKQFTADATSYTFSGLDGDTDGIYYFTFKIKNNAGSQAFYSLQPNGVTTNQSYRQNLIKTDDSISTFSVLYCGTADPSGGVGAGEVWFHAKKTVNAIDTIRLLRGTYYAMISAVLYMYNWVGHWNDSSNNITSITFFSDQTNGLGNGSEILLYKYQQ